MNYAGGISSCNFMQSHLITSPLYIGEISVLLLYRRTYLSVAHRRDIISLIYGRIYLAVAHRRDTSLAYILTHLARRFTSARYQSCLYTDAPTSPLHIGEISVSFIYRRIYLAVAHRRDTSLTYILTHLARRCTSARYQPCLYTDAPTSPLHIGEISVSFIYRRIYLAVAHRRDISLSHIQTHLPCRCTSARYQSCLYTDAPSSPLYIGEISVLLIYRRT